LADGAGGAGPPATAAVVGVGGRVGAEGAGAVRRAAQGQRCRTGGGLAGGAVPAGIAGLTRSADRRHAAVGLADAVAAQLRAARAAAVRVHLAHRPAGAEATAGRAADAGLTAGAG